MNKRLIELEKILWIEDEYEEIIEYSSRLNRLGYLVDPVKSASEAIDRLQKNNYAAYIFDLKILPGKNEDWLTLDKEKREANPEFETYLGVELLRHLHQAQQEKNDLWQKTHFDFKKVIIFSVVNNKDISKKLISFGIPEEQILYKPSSDLNTLAEAIAHMKIGDK